MNVPGIDWLTVEAEILLTALLTVHTLVYVLCHVGTYLSFLLLKIITVSAVNIFNRKYLLINSKHQLINLVPWPGKILSSNQPSI